MSRLPRSVLACFLILILVASSFIMPVFAGPIAPVLTSELIPFVATSLLLAGESFTSETSVMEKCNAYWDTLSDNTRNYFAVQAGTAYLSGKKYLEMSSELVQSLINWQSTSDKSDYYTNPSISQPVNLILSNGTFRSRTATQGASFYRLVYKSGGIDKSVVFASPGIMNWTMYQKTSGGNVEFWAKSNIPGVEVFFVKSQSPGNVFRTIDSPDYNIAWDWQATLVSFSCVYTSAAGAIGYAPRAGTADQAEGRKWEVPWVPGGLTHPEDFVGKGAGDIVSDDGTVIDTPVTGDFANDYTGILGGIVGGLNRIWSWLSGLFVVADTVSLNWAPLQAVTGVKSVFPFSIPWDFWNLFKVFLASPQVPNFTMNFDVPIVGVSYPFKVDFTPFDKFAQILRVFVMLWFSRELIMRTKNLIWG